MSTETTLTLQEKTGDLIKAALDGEVHAIAHGCNAQGIMGAGIAAQVANTWPQLAHSYSEWCRERIGRKRPGGSVFEYWPARGIVVYNLITQINLGADAKLSYVKSAVQLALQGTKTAAFPTLGLCRVGCGIGGLDWETEVKPLFEKIQAETSVQMVVYSL